MFRSNSNKVQIMGVVNITPNSFSDGGRFLNENSFFNFVNKNPDIDIFDIGAESTAPFNDGIGAEEELSRIEEFFIKPVRDNALINKRYSIDTYKPEVMKYVCSNLPGSQLIWNDVSGVLDEETLRLINDQNLTYILSHTNVPDKILTSHHMDYCKDYESNEDFLQDITSSLREQVKLVDSELTIVDLCFGFSKSREQNLWLLEHYSRFAEVFKDVTQLIGISRKSFLRDPTGPKLSDPGVIEQVTEKQVHYLSSILNGTTNSDFIFRIHEYADIANLNSDSLR